MAKQGSGHDALIRTRESDRFVPSAARSQSGSVRGSPVAAMNSSARAGSWPLYISDGLLILVGRAD
ncbi:MAG: hypothetical protein ACR2PL_19845 [Dehalococcoidia bacterium]